MRRGEVVVRPGGCSYYAWRGCGAPCLTIAAAPSVVDLNLSVACTRMLQARGVHATERLRSPIRGPPLRSGRPQPLHAILPTCSASGSVVEPLPPPPVEAHSRLQGVYLYPLDCQTGPRASKSSSDMPYGAGSADKSVMQDSYKLCVARAFFQGFV